MIEEVQKIQTIFCQHCKELQKSNNTTVECWYNPLTEEGQSAFCSANEDAVKAIIDELYSKCDEGRLLTLDEFTDCAKGISVATDVEKCAEPWRFGAKLIEKQDAKTASIVRAEIVDKVKKIELPIATTGNIQEACRRAILREVQK